MLVQSFLVAVVASPLAFACRGKEANATMELLDLQSRGHVNETVAASVSPDSTLRLLKTSETDPGTWVREDEKIEKYVARHIDFIDVTDIAVRISTCSAR